MANKAPTRTLRRGFPTRLKQGHATNDHFQQGFNKDVFEAALLNKAFNTTRRANIERCSQGTVRKNSCFPSIWFTC